MDPRRALSQNVSMKLQESFQHELLACKYSTMADKAGTSAAESAAGASTAKAAGDAANGSASTAAPKKPGSQGNPAFRMMGMQ